MSAVASDRLSEAAAIAVGNRQHRICYRTALYEHDLLTRPGHTVQVAVDRRLNVQRLGGHPLESIIEDPGRISIATEHYGLAMISTIERALLESAQVPRRVGGIASVAEALAGAEFDGGSLEATAHELGAQAGLRRLVSLANHLGIDGLKKVDLPERRGRPLPLDPIDPRRDGWLDNEMRVRWPRASRAGGSSGSVGHG